MTSILSDYVLDLVLKINLQDKQRSKSIKFSPSGRLLAVAGFISLYSLHDWIRFESLGMGDDEWLEFTYGYVSGWGIGSA